MSPRGKSNTERINVFFSPDTTEKLKSLSTDKGTTVSGLVRMIVLEYLEKESKPKVKYYKLKPEEIGSMYPPRLGQKKEESND